MFVSGAASARFQKVSMPPPPTSGRRAATSNMLNRPTVSVVRLRDELDAGALLLDVREAGERAVVALPGGEWVPVGDLRAGAAVAGVEPGVRVYVYCKTGGRSGEAVDLLRARGVDAVNVEGGILAWIEQVEPDLPTY